jgi:beta-alanine--pyruvate transaminase
LATLDLYEREGLFARAKTLAATFEAALHSLRDRPHVIDIRNLGLMGAIELAPRPGAPGARGQEAFRMAFDEQDLLVRVTGDTIALSPPLIISADEIGQIAARLGAVLGALA